MGSVFYDPEFPFPDGGPPADKLLILLNEPREEYEPYIFVWGNSHDFLRPGITLGCYEAVQYFFIPANNRGDFFEKNTWIYLYDCFATPEFPYTVANYMGTISEPTLGQIIKCAKAVAAIAGQYIEAVTNSWRRKFRSR
jgi:hypothetical protein